MATMRVELVGPERSVWSGQASYVGARTVAGGIGILAGHEPLLATLAPGVVTIRPESGEDVLAAVSGGFMSVTSEGVSILAEVAELRDDVDASAAREQRDEARSRLSEDPDDEDAQQLLRAAEARMRLAGES